MTEIKHPLHTEALTLTKEERRLTSQVIATLQNISDQKLFLKWGYSSLYDYCTKSLGYSEACAYRRVAAVKIMREIPQVKQSLEDGSLNLTNLTMAQSLISRIEKCETATGLDLAEKSEIIKQIESCSKLEAEVKLQRIAKERGVEFKKPKDSVKIIGEEALLQVSISAATLTKLYKIRNLRAHKNPNMSFGELIEDMAEVVLKKIDPERVVHNKGQGDSKRGLRLDTKHDNEVNKVDSPMPIARSARYVSRQLRAKIWQRDQGRCSYVSYGRRCDSRHLLQVDHIQPVQFGGPATEGNLRLLCHAHHRARGALLLQ